MDTKLQRNDILIKRKFNSYLVPGVMMAVAMQLGNIIDCIFVSLWIDLDGLSAISLSMPVLLLMKAVGLTIGGGCAAVISVMLLYLEGWMDTSNAPLLAQALNELDDGVEQLVLDMAKLEYTSSAGIRQIVAIHKQMNGALTLRHVTPEIAAVLHMIGVDKKLHIEP